jgi:hypothetical protein
MDLVGVADPTESVLDPVSTYQPGSAWDHVPIYVVIVVAVTTSPVMRLFVSNPWNVFLEWADENRNNQGVQGPNIQSSR